MIDREDAIGLIERLGGDEHEWVDAKEDYYVLGLNNKKAEFVKDVAAMTNTSTDRDSHYIFIGVEDDTGKLVGVSDDFAEESDPRHILGVDEADLQQVIAEYLAPTPSINLYTYMGEEPYFGLLSINQLNKKPCVVQKSIDFHGERQLHSGLIYFRSGSSNAIAHRSDLEKMIDERVQNRRKEILEGIERATEIGPEAVANVGELVYEEDGDIVVEVGEEGDFVLEERFSREPLSDLDQRLTLDIKRWATTDNITIDNESLWEYYSNPDKISVDEESILFLTKASLDAETYGAFWLTYADIDAIREILYTATNGLQRNEKMARILAAIGDKKGLEELYSRISHNTSIGVFPELLAASENMLDSRLGTVLKSTSHEIEYREWKGSIDSTSMNETELRDMIKEISHHLEILEQRFDKFDRWYQLRNEFRDALGDAELALLAKSH